MIQGTFPAKSAASMTDVFTRSPGLGCVPGQATVFDDGRIQPEYAVSVAGPVISRSGAEVDSTFVK